MRLADLDLIAPVSFSCRENGDRQVSPLDVGEALTESADTLGEAADDRGGD